MGLDVMGSDLGPKNHADRIAGDFEFDQSEFPDGIDHDDFATASPQVHQAGHQARMVAWGISTDDKDRIALVEILKDHGGCAGPEGGLQSYAAGLVAVVTAVVDVVGPIDSGKKLEQKTCFVARSAAEIPKRLIRIERLELGADPGEGFGPCDGAIIRFALFVEDRLDESAAGFELPGGPATHLRDGELGPEICSDGRLHVGGHGLKGFFADFGERTVFVDHAAVLATHPQGTGLAGVSRPQGLVHFPNAAGFEPFAECVSNGLPTSAGLESSHGCLSALASSDYRLNGSAKYDVIIRSRSDSWTAIHERNILAWSKVSLRKLIGSKAGFFGGLVPRRFP